MSIEVGHANPKVIYLNRNAWTYVVSKLVNKTLQDFQEMYWFFYKSI